MRKIFSFLIIALTIACLVGCANKNKSLDILMQEYFEETKSEKIKYINENQQDYYDNRVVEEIEYSCYKIADNYRPDYYIKLYFYAYFNDGTSELVEWACHLDNIDNSQQWKVLDGKG